MYITIAAYVDQSHKRELETKEGESKKDIYIYIILYKTVFTVRLHIVLGPVWD